MPTDYTVGLTVAHYFDGDEPKYFLGTITKIPPKKNYWWVTFEDGQQVKCKLPVEGYGKFWVFVDPSESSPTF